jgi:shikimate dehydrogenase
MLHLEGLRSYSPAGTALAVVGYPIAHSVSPIFQNAALRVLECLHPELKSWHYLRIEARVEELGEVLALAKDRGFRGLNLTLPHKVEVLRFVDDLDGLAARMGAVNTLSLECGGWKGYNTDGPGVERAIRLTLGVDVKKVPVIMVGAGGAARAACIQCLEKGCPALWVVNRSKDRLDELVAQLHAYYPDRDVGGGDFTTELPGWAAEALLIHGTSLGLQASDPLPLPTEMLAKVKWVYDMVYFPGLTRLVRESNALGLAAADGLQMLVSQGALALSLWTGLEAPEKVMLEAASRHLGRNPDGTVWGR